MPANCAPVGRFRAPIDQLPYRDRPESIPVGIAPQLLSELSLNDSGGSVPDSDDFLTGLRFQEEIRLTNFVNYFK